MALVILLGACFLWWCVYYVGRELVAENRNREETRIWVEAEKQEWARLEAGEHQQRLAAIEAARLNGLRELRRIAAEAKGEIIDGSCQEVERRPS
jgi:hypothetical protein